MKNKNHRRLSITLMLFVQMLFAASFVACSDDDDNTSATNPEVIESYNSDLGAKVTELKTLKDASVYGALQGQFPEESKEILNLSIEKMELVLSNILENKYVEPTALKLSFLIAEAGIAIEEFKISVRLTDWVNPVEKYELLVNGKDQGYIDFGISSLYSDQTDFTVEFWVKMDDEKYKSDFVTFLSTFTDGGGERKGWFINNNGGNLRMSYALMNNGLWEPSDPTPDFSDWTHVAMVTQITNTGKTKHLKIYINGALFKETPFKEHDNAYSPNNGTQAPMVAFMSMQPNGNIDTGKACNGYMKHLHIWNTAKSAETIRRLANYQMVITGEEEDLICGWALNDMPEGDGSVVKNIKEGGLDATLRGDFEWIENKE